MKTTALPPRNQSLSAHCPPPKSNEPADIKDWCLARADVWYAQKDFALAGIFLQYAQDIDPMDVQIAVALGSLHFSLGNLGAALVAFTRADQLHPRDTTIQLHLALTHQQRQEWAEAESFFKKALALRPENLAALKLYSGYLMFRERYTEARELIERALSFDLDDVELFLRLGVCCFQTRDFRAAQACYNRVIQLEPSNAIARENLDVVVKVLKCGTSME